MRAICLVLTIGLFAAGCGDDDMTVMCSGDPGTAGCQCRGDMSCDDGLTCSEGLCVGATVTGLVFPAGVRGCDLLLRADGVTSAEFGEQVQGTFVAELPNIAVSVVTTTDADFQPGAVTVTSASDFELVSSSCVDGSGVVAPGAQVTVQ